jgi:hypothetical protein
VVSRTAAALAIVAGLLPAATRPVPAQSLARLTVESFALSSDAEHPAVETPFHLMVTLRVRERVNQIANLELPILADLELLGDERQTASSSRGTQYRETITVVAHRAGAIAISPATMQAVDARDGKAKQWYTNALTIHVVAAAPSIRQGAQVLFGLLWLLVRILFWVLVVGCLAFALVFVFRRRRERPAPAPAMVPPPPAPAPAVVVRSRRDDFADALAVLRTERTRLAAVRVRTAVWRMVGANDGETLGDVLRRPESSETAMHDLLISLERSAFTYDDDLRAAIDDACAAFERYIGTLA